MSENRIQAKNRYIDNLLRSYGYGAAPDYSPPPKSANTLTEEIQGLQKEIEKLRLKLNQIVKP